ncbi:MAG: tRNA (guanosine(37)-N1)-methyltransferase TrmD [Gammaproteobacteria bacterium]
MRIAVVTLFPEMLVAITKYGVTGRCIKRGLLQVTGINPRDFAKDRRATVDDRPYGGGPGMVMMVGPLREAIQSAVRTLGGQSRVLYLSPQGRRLDQRGVRELARGESVVMVTGRYEGADERVIQTDVHEEWSIGDYVLSGGELAAMVVIDAVARILPGALGHEDSAREDSFSLGLLDYPHYTRPEVIDGQGVPEVLLNGNHEAIARWRRKQALGRTWLKRPDLVRVSDLDREQCALLDEFIEEHYGGCQEPVGL